jgi:hypothetical protein
MVHPHNFFINGDEKMPLPKIDVLIPAIEKDLGTLPYVIDSVRSMVKHPIGRIMIVSPNTERMKRLCKQKGCTFINESTVLPITKKNINYRSTKWERSGWLYQQLLKLGGDALSSQKYYLVIDADTVLIRPHVFRTTGGRTVFYCRKWSQPEYFITYRKLLGQKAGSPSSFVTHYMLFERSKVRKLKKIIAARHQTTWYGAIIRSINKKKQFGFSEFETYGNFLHAHYPGTLSRKPALNKSLHIKASRLSAAKRKRLSLKYRSISFHKRKGYSRK